MAAGALVVFGVLAALAGTSAPGDADVSGAEIPHAHGGGSASGGAPERGEWTTDSSEVWIARDRRAVAFEVRARHRVDVWMRTIHPALVVRCAAGQVEAFVFTDSAAKMEPDTPDHTVTFRFDQGPELTERWPDAEAHDALFAPDGAAFARRLTSARRLTFRFTPHNAQPVTAEFLVGGLEELMTAARPCSTTRKP